MINVYSLVLTGRPRSYRKYILKIMQPSQYGYARLQYRFAVTSGSPSSSEAPGIEYDDTYTMPFLLMSI